MLLNLAASTWSGPCLWRRGIKLEGEESKVYWVYPVRLNFRYKCKNDLLCVVIPFWSLASTTPNNLINFICKIIVLNLWEWKERTLPPTDYTRIYGNRGVQSITWYKTLPSLPERWEMANSVWQNLATLSFSSRWSWSASLQVSVEGRTVITRTIAYLIDRVSFAQQLERLRAGSVPTFEQYARSLQLCRLRQCSVANSREGPFSIVEKFLQLDEVCLQFGSFMKLLCDTQELESATSTTGIAMRNAFGVLMQSQAALSQRVKLPPKIGSHYKKNKLFNDLVDLVKEKGWTWVDGGNTLGKPFLLKLRDVLWYIDGHHAAFKTRFLPIPAVFKQFSGYNTLEHSKHRKMKVGNMSNDILISHVSYLKECLLVSWMQQQRWCALWEIIDELATSLDNCTTYLHQQVRIVNQNQDSLKVNDSRTLKILPINDRSRPLAISLPGPNMTGCEQCLRQKWTPLFFELLWFSLALACQKRTPLLFRGDPPTVLLARVKSKLSNLI